MPFISPMLASPCPKKLPDLSCYCAEEKWDGHRLILEIAAEKVMAWSRLGKVRQLPNHLSALNNVLPAGIYDGELLVPGKRSYNVTELDMSEQLVFVAFDILRCGSVDTLGSKFIARRALLDTIIQTAQRDRDMPMAGRGQLALQLSRSRLIPSEKALDTMLQEVWKRDGEGLILKQLNSPYLPGKRPKLSWLKMKQLKSTVCTLYGFQAGKMGPHSVMLLRDDAGNETQTKWKNHAQLDEFNANSAAFIGRRVRIEYQERTPEGNYRHPRFDRWEDE